VKRIGLIVNPTAGNGQGRVDGSVANKQLAKHAEIIDLSGTSRTEAEANGTRAIKEHLIDGLVVVGGDGTVNLGVNLCAQTDVPLGIIPSGTGNDAARSLDLVVGDAEAAACQVISSLDNPRIVDLVKAQTSNQSFWYFCTISAGFDALVNQTANRWKWPKGPSRYKLAMLAELAKFKPIHYRAVIDGVSREFDAMLCSVNNSKAFGGGMLVTPDAKVDDGWLDVFIVHKISRLELIKVFPKVYTGEHVSHPAVEIIRAKKVSIESGNMPAYSDGEARGYSPISAEIAPQALRVFAPK
jgi:diacylglycerol kinase (ATP)